MANEEHLAILRQGVAAWNAWREKRPRIRPYLERAELDEINLSGANLREVNLELASLNMANLSNADMYRAIMFGASFVEADLRGANLTKAIVVSANFRGANLNGANLSEVDLTSSDFREALLDETNFNHCTMGGNIFADSDLSCSLGLDSVKHISSSTIGVDILYQRKGKIPESFLRGCGVPESFIEYLPSLLGAMEPIQFYSCFISYSSKDHDFVTRLHGRMQQKGLRVWFANEDLKGGYKLHEQIDEAIRVYDKFIIVLSPESLRSKWVMNEVRRTRKAELANSQRKFFPIALMPYRELQDWECIDPETGTDLAAEIREYYVPDFRDWKNHDSFEKAFAQLLEGLKAVDAPPAPRIEAKVKPMEVHMQEGYIKVLQALARMESQKKPMISPRDIATDLGEDEQYVSDILEVLEKQKGLVEKKAEWKGDDQRPFIVGTTPLGRMYLRELESGKMTVGTQSNVVITAKKRRLEKLEEQAAIKGISTPPEVLTEIEDLRREIGERGG